MMSLAALYLVFVKYGLLAFGGGYALVPMIIADLVDARRLMTAAEFGNLVAVAQVTPGPIGINTATYVGFTQGGIPGALAATLGLITPSLALVLLAAHFLKKWENQLLIRGLLNGLRPAAFGLVLTAIVIFAEISVFTAKIPVDALFQLLRGVPAEWNFAARPVPALIAAAAAAVQLKTKVPVVVLIGVGALLGALCCR